MRKILIVDDQNEIRELVKKTLTREDRTILTADSGETAVQIAREQLPDLIMMDVMMPGSIDGLEATRLLKQDEKTRHCTILVLTAKGRPEDREQGLAAGANDYFAKPFSPLELMKKVDEVLG